MPANCPYCLSDINDKALVCKYCQREVSLVLSLMKEIEILKNNASVLSAPVSVEPAVRETRKSIQYSFSILLFIYLFFITGLLVMLFISWPETINLPAFFPKNMHMYVFQIVSVPFSIIVTWLVVRFSKNSNLLTLLVYALAPYALMYVLYHEFLFDKYGGRYFINALIYISVINLVCSAISAILSFRFYATDKLSVFFSIKSFANYWIGWQKSGQNVQEYIQKLISLLTALGTLITFILTRIYDKQ